MNRILSGVQPTGNLHLGNYLGAIRNWVGMQHDYECLFMLADMHAITIPQDPDALRNATREVAAAYIACGIDAEKQIIFPQSAVSMHAELAWILSCHTPLGWLNRMTQFKEKSGARTGVGEAINNLSIFNKLLKRAIKLHANFTNQVKTGSLNHQQLVEAFTEKLQYDRLEDEAQTYLVQSINSLEETMEKTGRSNLGLYSYPVLMAADIIGYKATHVPVGEDQKQHLELARDIAGAFNRQYDQEFFPLPEPVIMGTATRVMSLRDGTKKMSKSDESEYSRITLTDDADMIAKKVKKAKSDMIEGLSWDPEGRPEAANLINIFSALSGESKEAIIARYETSGFAPFKQDLAEVAVAHLSPITAKMRELMDDKAYLDGVLKRGSERANIIAQGVLNDVKDVVGFLKL